MTHAHSYHLVLAISSLSGWVYFGEVCHLKKKHCEGASRLPWLPVPAVKELNWGPSLIVFPKSLVFFLTLMRPKHSDFAVRCLCDKNIYVGWGGTLSLLWRKWGFISSSPNFAPTPVLMKLGENSPFSFIIVLLKVPVRPFLLARVFQRNKIKR